MTFFEYTLFQLKHLFEMLHSELEKKMNITRPGSFLVISKKIFADFPINKLSYSKLLA